MSTAPESAPKPKRVPRRPRRPGAQPNKRGPKPGGISPAVKENHRAWLVPIRTAYLESGMTVRSLAAGWQPSRVSELMRGTGDYPRYEYVLSIARALKVTPGTLPVKELRISWKLGAQDLGKTDAWIDKCLHEEARRIARRRTWGQALAIVAMTTLTASLFLGMQQTEEDRFSDPPMTTPTTGPTLGQDEGPEPEPATPPPTTSPPLPLDRLKPYPVEPESLPAEHMAASDEDMPVYVGVARGRPDVRWKLPADTVVPVDCVTELKDEIFVRIAGKPGGFVKPADSSYLTKLTPGELPDCQLKR